MTDKTPSSATDTTDTTDTTDATGAADTAEATDAADTRREDVPDAPAGRPVVEVSPGAYKRLTTGLGGFAMAMGACLLLVLAIYFVTPRGGKETLPTVDYGSQLWAMRNGAPFTVYAPEGLPERWRPTSSRVHGLGSDGKKPVAWHLGFVTPGDEYAALEQSNENPAKYVPRMANSSKPIGTQQVAGFAWTKYHRKDKKANSLARTLPDGTSLVVTGTATYEELAILAGALKPQPKGAGLTPSATPGP